MTSNPPPAANPPPVDQKPVNQKPVNPPSKTDGTTWLKEGVTAFLAIAIIIATLALLWPSLSSGDTTEAQGIFAILGGWGGVVLGYYFGRVPAEKASDNANKAADKATDTAKQALSDKGDMKAAALSGLAAIKPLADSLQTRVSSATKVGVRAIGTPEYTAIMDDLNRLNDTIKQAQDRVNAI